MSVSNEVPNSARAIVTALVGNFCVCIIKIIGWLVSSSPSMLAEALHSFADVMNQTLIFVGIHKANKSKATSEHPWGTQAIQYLFNFMSAVGIFALGCVLTIWHAIHDYMNPGAGINTQWWWLSLAILAISFFVEGYTCFVAFKDASKEKGDLTWKEYLNESENTSVLAVLLEDSAAMVGIVLAMGGVLISHITQNPLADIVTALVIGVMMGLIAIFLGYINAKLLMGKAISTERQENYAEFILSLPAINKISEMKTEILGPGRIHLSFKADIDAMAVVDTDWLKELSKEVREGDELVIRALMDAADHGARSAAREIGVIEKQIKKEFPEITIIDIEME